jgi:hypothetical protein
MSERSFVRVGGLAGVLLAITSWASVAVYYTLVPAAQKAPINDFGAYVASLTANRVGSSLFYGLYALLAFFALLGILAAYQRVRVADEAWAFAATVIGSIAAVGTILAGLEQVSRFDEAARLSGAGNAAAAVIAVQAPSAINPYGLMTFGLTAFWFIIEAGLLWRIHVPRLLPILAVVAFLDLAVGFVATLAGSAPIALLAGVIAGGVGGPIFWLWFGYLLLRDADLMSAQE